MLGIRKLEYDYSGDLAKRLKTTLSDHPIRPGQPECEHFSMTRTCKFGMTCKFNHTPVFPQRPGQPPCSVFLKTGLCGYGDTCRFDHPRFGLPNLSSFSQPGHSIPDQFPGQTPQGLSQATSNPYPYPSAQNYPGQFMQPAELTQPDHSYSGSAPNTSTFGLQTPLPQLGQSEMGMNPYLAMFSLQAGGIAPKLPERPGQPECSFYMKTGFCEFGINCRFSHPAKGIAGQAPCEFFMKTGLCKFGAQCRFAHPPIPPGGIPKINPRNPNEPPCKHFVEHGSCMFGLHCKFDHPPKEERKQRSETIPKKSLKSQLKLVRFL